MSAKSDRYKEAGVDIDLAGQLLAKVKDKIKKASRPEVLAPIGGFGGLFQLNLESYRQPVLVSSIDGVGTKLIVAAKAENFRFVGHDIVNHCVNDIIVQGAQPLYFLDYVGIGRLRNPLYQDVLNGIIDACEAQNVALIGGETAEMPGVYQDEFDLVGCITGVVERDRIISGETISAGDVGIGLASNGLHTNGYSLARKVLLEEAGLDLGTQYPELEGATLAEALLRPHVCYWPVIRTLLDMDDVVIKGMAHITGGGFYDNIPRILPDNVDVICHPEAFSKPPIFEMISKLGNVSSSEMYRVFNMGIGMIVFVEPSMARKVCDVAYQAGIPAMVMADVVAGNRKVRIAGIDD